MARAEFTDGTQGLLRTHPALPPERTRELAGQFNRAQEAVCRNLAALSYPLDRVVQELKAGHLPLFREGSDQDRRRNLGRKASYRFAGVAPSHVAEYDATAEDRHDGRISPEGFETWQARFLAGFTYEVIELVSHRALPAPGPAAAARLSELNQALAEAGRLRDEILLGNLLLVAKTVMRRGGRNDPMALDDLFAAGMDGLLIAIGRYDPAVGQFSTYAMPWIAMAIDRFAAKTRSVIRIPIGAQERARKRRAAGAEADDPALLLPEVQSLEDAIPGFEDSEMRLEDVVADPMAEQAGRVLEKSDIAGILRERLLEMDDLRQFILAMRNDVGDALALGAKLFAEEMELSRSRGRAIAASAHKTSDEPARIRMIGTAAAAPVTPEPVALELAV